jgi:sulfhydrogenase subunit gamma (sulfur reductase)
MSELHEAKLIATRPAGEGLVALTIDVRGTPLVGTHLHPGQYVKLTTAEHPQSFFAIASAPGEHGAELELLIKRGTPLAEALASAPLGATLKLSAPLGKGFPLAEARGKDVLLVATGSGISPIRSLIGSIRVERAVFGTVTLYWGARTPHAFAYEEEWAAWEHDRIRIVRTVSKPLAEGGALPPGGPEWTGLTGYVQAHLQGGSFSGAVAFLCGQKAMIEGVAAELERRGMPRSAVFTNF